MRFAIARRTGSYVVASTSLAFVAVSLIGYGVTDDLRWTIALAGIGLLVYQLTVPAGGGTVPEVLMADRTAFDSVQLGPKLRAAREIWLFAPSGAHVLTSAHCDMLRRHVLDQPGGSVRVVVLDPARADAVRLTAHQLTDGVDFPGQRFEWSLAGSVDRLRLMAGWRCAGSFGYRLFGYNPGFSLLALDPRSPAGTVIVEFHGAHNESTSSRMHLTLTRSGSRHWYGYWIGQFEHIWRISQLPGRH